MKIKFSYCQTCISILQCFYLNFVVYVNGLTTPKCWAPALSMAEKKFAIEGEKHDNFLLLLITVNNKS